MHVKKLGLRFTFSRFGFPYVLIVSDLLIPRVLEADDVDCGQRAAAVGGRQVAFNAAAAAAAKAVHAVESHNVHHQTVTLLRKAHIIFFFSLIFRYLNSAVLLYKQKILVLLLLGVLNKYCGVKG